jgi:WD40 repeat protein
MTFARSSDDIASAAASAQLVSTAGLRLGARYRLPAGYLIDRGVAGYLLLSGHSGGSVLWNPRTGQIIRRFADVIAAGPEQIVWTQGCGTCRVQILSVTRGGTVTTRLAGSQLATPDPVLSSDGKLLAVRLAHGPVSVLDTSNGALTEIPGTALSGAVSLVLGWPGDGHRLVIIIWPKADPGVIQLGYWQPGERRLTVAAPSNYGSELPDQLIP